MEIDQPLNLSEEMTIFKSQLKQAKDKVSHWIDPEFAQLIAAQESKQENTIRKLQEDKIKLQEVLSDKQKKSSAAAQRLEEKCKQLEKLKTELEQLYSVAQQLHERKAKHETKVDEMQQEIRQTKQDMEAPTKAKEQLKYLAEASGVFESCLGLSFKKVKGKQLQVVFTHIDEKDPLMPFYFFLTLTGASRKYTVSGPEPPVEGLEELVSRLNETNNLRQFMLDMRRKFKDTLKKDRKE